MGGARRSDGGAYSLHLPRAKEVKAGGKRSRTVCCVVVRTSPLLYTWTGCRKSQRVVAIWDVVRRRRTRHLSGAGGTVRRSTAVVLRVRVSSQ